MGEYVCNMEKKIYSVYCDVTCIVNAVAYSVVENCAEAQKGLLAFTEQMSGGGRNKKYRFKDLIKALVEFKSRSDLVAVRLPEQKQNIKESCLVERHVWALHSVWPNLYLCSLYCWQYKEDVKYISDAGVTTYVDLAGSTTLPRFCDNLPPDNMRYVPITVKDNGEANLVSVASIVWEHIKEPLCRHEAVMIGCRSARNRSAAVIALIFSLIKDQVYWEVLNDIMEVRILPIESVRNPAISRTLLKAGETLETMRNSSQLAALWQTYNEKYKS